jgi:hypothetical protein
MCTSLILPDDRLCETIGELRAILGDVPIKDDYPSPLEDNCCTCPVDFQALAKREGWTLAHDDWDSMRYVASVSPRRASA